MRLCRGKISRRRRLIRQPSLGRQRVAHGLVDLRTPCAETGLSQVPANGVPVRRKAVRRVDRVQDKGADIGKRSQNASAAWRAFF
jgi:hypothetical protein